METPPTRKPLRFGVFEADPASGELRKQGRRLRLAAQPFQVLLLLLENPGNVVPREEIRKRLWPDGTFVDFDHGLNAAIAKLREALGDSAANPRFVETVAKRGYRFIAPVEKEYERQQGVTSTPLARPEPPLQANQSFASAAAVPERALEPASNGLQRYLTRPEDVPQNRASLARVLFLLVQLMYLVFYITALGHIGEISDRLLAAWPYELAPAAAIASAAVGVPVRLYLISGVLFRARGMLQRFLSVLFPLVLILDVLWAASPFLLVPRISLGLALAATAALAYLPFAQRTLVLMGALGPTASDQKPANSQE